MAIQCTKCGEELLGAVNRCWKCGQSFDVTTPASAQPLAATVIDSPAMPLAPVTVPLYAQERQPSTADLIEARRAGIMAMGGTVTSLVFGIFAAALAFVWPLAALIAVLGLLMGIWGLQSPKRNLALIGMLLCCLSIGVGTYSAVSRLYLSYKQRQPIQMPYDSGTIDTEP